MNKIILLLVAAAIFACNKKSADEKTSESFGKYGDTTITAEGAIGANELLTQLAGKDSLETKVEGTINACCQKKGCWMTVDLGDGKEMRVKFKDYGFFVPMNSAGHKAIMQGVAYIDTVSVEELKHLAKDAEKTQEEIDAIDAPEVEYTFLASGVIIK